MKILVLNGSPKKERSDTMIMTRAFLDGITSKTTAEIETIDIYDKNIKPCQGCFACWKVGDCVLKDDVAEILGKYIKADVTIWSFPLYHFSMPAMAKALMERTLPLMNKKMEVHDGVTCHTSRIDYTGKRYVLISGSGFPDIVGNFDALITQFRRIYQSLLTPICVCESPLFNVPFADVVTKPFLEIIKKAGAEFAADGAVSKETLKKLAIPMISQEEYVAQVNS